MPDTPHRAEGQQPGARPTRLPGPIAGTAAPVTGPSHGPAPSRVGLRLRAVRPAPGPGTGSGDAGQREPGPACPGGTGAPTGRGGGHRVPAPGAAGPVPSPARHPLRGAPWPRRSSCSPAICGCTTIRRCVRPWTAPMPWCRCSSATGPWTRPDSPRPTGSPSSPTVCGTWTRGCGTGAGGWSSAPATWSRRCARWPGRRRPTRCTWRPTSARTRTGARSSCGPPCRRGAAGCTCTTP